MKTSHCFHRLPITRNSSPTSHAATSRLAAFTLIELLTVIAIIGILAAIIIPVAGRVRETAWSARCISNLRETGTLTRLYSEENRGRLPKFSADPFPVQLWKYVYPGSITMDSSAEIPSILANTLFECPAATKEKSPPFTYVRSYGMNPYLVPTHPDRNSGVPVNLVEVPSQAALYADVKNSSTLKPGTCNPRHDDKMHVVFADGHVARIKPTPEMTKSGAETTLLFWTGTP
ncbi:MAG: prepilin-type N-terminal cleavage/methylation domain-containing protein [Opitutaceae bacterium]|jgi:general secretion pathway protein G|nr:prepilin-type N-terminal cleavage/methylation domain-containing protein [Opitutaceae bacterium]